MDAFVCEGALDHQEESQQDEVPESSRIAAASLVQNLKSRINPSFFDVSEIDSISFFDNQMSYFTCFQSKEYRKKVFALYRGQLFTAAGAALDEMLCIDRAELQKAEIETSRASKLQAGVTTAESRSLKLASQLSAQVDRITALDAQVHEFTIQKTGA